MRNSKPFSLSKINTRHHALARCLALGMTPGEASLAVGYDPCTVSNLQRDELFKELMAFYANQAIDTFEVATEQLRGLTMEALTVLRERIEEGDISTKELIEAAKLATDRTGHGPTSTQVNVDATPLIERMERARKRLQEVTVV